MTTDPAELAARFHEMSDDELLARARSGDLTELAQDVARAELAARGLAQAGAQAEDEQAAVAPVLGPLRIATRFLLPVDAQVFAARLEQEGIVARVMDADTVYAVGAFMGSLARGGVRVMVPESQLDAAERVLAAYNAGEYAIDDDFDVNQ
jgi:hypothetical protein